MTGPPTAWKRAALAAVVLSIAAATLQPVRDVSFTPPVSCVICGSRGVSDFILNIIMFLPLGVMLAWSGVPLRWGIVTGVLLSGMVEVAQLVIPGRDSSLGDLIGNSAGSALGLLAVVHAGGISGWIRRHQTAASTWYAVTIIAILAATGWLLAPSYPASRYFGQWTPNLGHLEWYRGQVLDARVGDFPIERNGPTDADRVRSSLYAGATIDVRAVAGPTTSRLASLVSIYDGRQREIVLLGPDGDDLVYRYRARAASWRLDQPDQRAWGALAGIGAGDSLRVRVAGDPLGSCIEVNARPECGLGFTVGKGWSLFLYPEGVPSVLLRALNLVWLGALTFPIGFILYRRRNVTIASGLVAVGLVGAPLLTVLAPTPPAEWIAAIFGILAGIAGRVGRRSRTH